MNNKRMEKFNMNSQLFSSMKKEEAVRLGILKEGIQLITHEIHLPLYGQVIPRVEIQITGDNFEKRVTVRINQASNFMFDGNRIISMINDDIIEVREKLCFDEERNKLGMYNFGLMRENGIRSFVFDYHTYCCYSCEFCFKENEWENLALEGYTGNSYQNNYDKCIEYVHTHAEKLVNGYDIIWLCTGSIEDLELELERHCKLARALREIGYQGGIYLSQVIPKSIVREQTVRRTYLEKLYEAGVSRFNSGVEIVNQEFRKKYIHGYKSDITFEDYVNTFKDAIDIFGHHNVGSCLLAGIEKAEDTIKGLEVISEIGVVPAPTVFTPFVKKQEQIPFMLSYDELLKLNKDFNALISKYKLPVFSGVFSLA